MRRPVQIAMIATVVLLAAATSVLYVRYRETSANYTDMKVREEASQTRYAKTIDAIAEIQDSLNSISVVEENAKLQSAGLRDEQNLTGPRNQQALEGIALLRASILRSRDRIHQLEGSVHASGIKVAGLQRMINQLKQTAAEKEQLVADLTQRVEALQTEVTGLATTVQETQDIVRARDQALEERRRELATVYYVIADKKQLTGSGVVEAKGGLLGVGQTLTPSGQVDPSVLIPLDTDQVTFVRTDAPKAKVLSAQPHASYEMIIQDGQVVLHILDPSEFRKVRQLVILRMT